VRSSGRLFWTMQKKRSREHVEVEFEDMVFPVVGSKDLSKEMKNASKAPPNWQAQWDAIFAYRGYVGVL